jgi:SAM-dependent methyltransferase
VIPLPLAAGSRPSLSDRPTLADAPLEPELLHSLQVAASLAELRPAGALVAASDSDNGPAAASGGDGTGAPHTEGSNGVSATMRDDTEQTQPNASQQDAPSLTPPVAAATDSVAQSGPSDAEAALPPLAASDDHPSAAREDDLGAAASGDRPTPNMGGEGSRSPASEHDGDSLTGDSDSPIVSIDDAEDEPQANPTIHVPELAQLRAGGSGAGATGAPMKRGTPAAEPTPPIARELSNRPGRAFDSPVPRAGGASASLSSPPRAPAQQQVLQGVSERVRPDSDAPTRPRIELSSNMALAAGRVTSLEVPPVVREALAPESDPYVPGRGSKIPPPGEPRVISSLTGRRSTVPAPSSDDEATRPSVVVTRSRIISDRPSRPDQLARGSEPAQPQPPAPLEAEARGTPAPSGREGAPQPLPTGRPSRRPSASADGDEFETLDIDSVVESAAPREGTSATEPDSAPSKAPPPPPQHKRVPTSQVIAAAAPPKAAPPPPPKAAQVAAAAPPTSAREAPPALQTAPALPTAPVNPVTAPMRKPGRGPRRRQWYETLFSDEYLRTVVRPSNEQISRQVDFMQASLGVTKGAAVLDVGCGLGQHALEFARRGCLVVALDLALPMITRAAEDAQQEGLRINFLHKDIRDIGFEGTFDAVICVGTTFGFFDDEQNREVLGRLANALKPGGRLLLEVVNRDHVLTSQPNLQWFEGDGCVVMEESDFNYYSSRISVKRTMMREDGRQTESEYSIRLYALHELGQMMQQVGFRVKEVSGQQATRGVFFGAHSNRIILLAERRVPGPQRADGHSSSDAPPDE